MIALLINDHAVSVIAQWTELVCISSFFFHNSNSLVTNELWSQLDRCLPMNDLFFLRVEVAFSSLIKNKSWCSDRTWPTRSSFNSTNFLFLLSTNWKNPLTSPKKNFYSIVFISWWQSMWNVRMILLNLAESIKKMPLFKVVFQRIISSFPGVLWPRRKVRMTVTAETKDYDPRLQTISLNISTNSKQKPKISEQSDFSNTGFTSISVENCPMVTII